MPADHETRISILENNLNMYVKQVTESVERLERSFTKHIDENSEALKSYTQFINNTFDSLRGDVLRIKLQQERFSGSRLTIAWIISTGIAIAAIIL